MANVMADWSVGWNHGWLLLRSITWNRLSWPSNLRTTTRPSILESILNTPGIISFSKIIRLLSWVSGISLTIGVRSFLSKLLLLGIDDLKSQLGGSKSQDIVMLEPLFLHRP